MNKFLKKVDMRSRKEMVSFLKDHFRYHTMNSWNGLVSYANNVKLHQLDLPKDIRDNAYEIISQGEFYEVAVRDTFQLFADTHTGFSLGTNGRSSGYVVLYEGKTSKGVDQGDDFSNWSMDDLRSRVKLICDLDQTCDDLVSELVEWASRYKVVEKTVMVPKKILCLEELEDG